MSSNKNQRSNAQPQGQSKKAKARQAKPAPRKQPQVPSNAANRRVKPKKIGNINKMSSLSEEATTNFLSNMMDPAHPFMIPRLIPTEAAANRYQSTMDFSSALNVKPDGSGWFVAMVQPSLETPVAVLKEDAAEESYNSPTLSSYHHIDQQGVWIDFDNQLVSTSSSGKFLNPYPISDGYHYGENWQQVQNGGKVYPGLLDTFALGTTTLRITNRGTATVAVKVRISDVMADKTRVPGTESDATNVSVGASQTLQFPAHTQNANAVGFALSFQVSSAASNVSLDVGVYGAAPVTGAYHWVRLPFFSSAGDYSEVMGLFREAIGVSTTGFSFLLQNHTNSLKKGGTLTAAKLVGSSRGDLPVGPSQLTTYLSNRNGRDTVSSAPLANGLFWSYTPEKIQDVMFRKHATVGNTMLIGDVTLPYIVIVAEWPDVDSRPTLKGTLKINMEYQTNSIVIPKTLPPADTSRFLEMWYALSSQRNHITENPNHLKNIGQWTRDAVRSLLRNEDFRHAAKSFGRVAGTAALALI